MRRVEILVQVPITASGSVTNSDYGVSSDEVATVHGEPVDTPIVPYDLLLDKEAPEVVMPGDLLTYTLNVTNPHPTAANHNLVLTDTLPAEVIFISATVPYSLAGNIVTWERPEIPSSGTYSFELVVQAAISGTGLIINDTYGVRSDEVAGVYGAPVTTLVTPLGVALSPGGSAFVLPGEVVTFTHFLTNTGIVSDTYDLSVGSTQGWSVLDEISPTLASGEAISITVTVTVPSGLRGGVVDVSTLTATSRMNALVSAQVVDTTQVLYRTFLPVIRK
jgi:uncharacterized repeat protein (TIGR01451 family)